MEPLLDIIDTETASLEGGICDIAIVTVDENLNVVRSLESLIDPERPISPQAMGIHHITDEMVAHEPTMDEFMEMHDFPWKREGLIVGGHNVQFDIRVSQQWLPPSPRRLCTLKLARLLYPDLPDHKLQTIRYHFKLDAGQAHRAMGDVRVCLAFMQMVAREKGIGLQGLLDIVAKPISMGTKLTFGKHKGTAIGDLPLSYIDWALGPNGMKSLDPDIREAFELRLK